MRKFTLAKLFDGNSRPEYDAVEKMSEQLSKLGGIMHFTIEKTAEGWTAACDEFPAIMTGGTTPNPSKEEIEESIRDAIHVAFHVPDAERARSVIRETESKEVRTYSLVSA